MTNYTITCHFCETAFDLDEDGNHPQELYDDGEDFKRKCPECGKNLVIKVAAHYTYEVDEFESDKLNSE